MLNPKQIGILHDLISERMLQINIQLSRGGAPSSKLDVLKEELSDLSQIYLNL